MNDIEPSCINLYVWDGSRERERSFQDRIYRTDFIAPAITTAFRPWYLIMNKDQTAKIIVVGRIEMKGAHDIAKRIYDPKGIAPTLHTCGGGNLEPKVLITKVDSEIVAMRGRNPEDPTDRTPGQPTEQRLERNEKGVSNTLTTVGKDNLVMETIQIKQATEKGYIEMENGGVADLSYPESSTSRGRVQDNGNICPTLTAQTQEIYKIDKQVVEQRCDEGLREFNGGVSGALRTTDSCGDKRVIEKEYRIDRQAQETFEENECEPGDCINPFNKSVDKSGCSPTITTRPEGMKTAVIPVTYDYRIRKLTPLECFRLMGVTDEDAHKMLSVNSNSQCYKQAGNSIVVDVMAAMFKRLF